MKRQKLPLVCMACAIAVIAGLVAANLTIDDEIAILSDAQLTSFNGGSIWCVDGCEASNCNCETHDCEDIECTPCVNGLGEDGTCKGNDGDTDDVKNCYYSSTDSDSCTTGTDESTSCQGDFWIGTSSGCTGVPTTANGTMMGNNCS